MRNRQTHHQWIPYLILTLAAPLVASPSVHGQSIRSLEGSLLKLVSELTGEDYCLRSSRSDPRPYLDPTDYIATFYQAARHLELGELEEACQLATEVDYEVYEFRDPDLRQRYYVMRENLEKLAHARGWGAYLFNPDSEIPAIVEAPHPVCDYDSAKVAALVFAQGAKGLLIAGTHREKADVPDLINSVFHQVHVAWTGTLGQVAAWQIHGYAKEKHSFPEDARAILSTGGGDIIDEIVRLNDQLLEHGVEGYVFNKLQPDDDVNVAINKGIEGKRFQALAATKNEQGRHLRELGGAFVHVELEREVRADHEKRQLVSQAIAAAMVQAKGALEPPSYPSGEPVAP